MVTDLFEASAESVTLLPATNVSVSVFDPAEKLVPPTVIVLKISWAEPGSLFSIVRPFKVIPLPAPSSSAPDSPWREVTRLAESSETVRSWSPVTVIPVPPVTE